MWQKLKSDDQAKFASEIHELGFDIISAPRKGRWGGVAVIFNPKYVAVVQNNVKCSCFEATECVLETYSGLLRFCTIYRITQKASDETKVSKFMAEFENYLDTVLKKMELQFYVGTSIFMWNMRVTKWLRHLLTSALS